MLPLAGAWWQKLVSLPRRVRPCSEWASVVGGGGLGQRVTREEGLVDDH